MMNKLTTDTSCDAFLNTSLFPDLNESAEGGTLLDHEIMGGRGEKLRRSDKVLILEANKHVRLSRTRILSREGYDVTSVSTVEEAVQAVQRRSYGLFIMSVVEPDLLNMLLAQFPPTLGILMITTQDIVGKIVECSGVGIHSFLVHPFSAYRFREAVAQIIDKTRLVKEGFKSEILSTLACTNRLLAAEDETDKFFKLVVEKSATDTRADYVSLSVKDEETGKFVVKTQIGDYEPSWRKISQRVEAIGQPMLLDVTRQDHSELNGLMTKAGISAMLYIPLIIEGEVFGAINHIKVKESARFISSDLNFASILGWWSSLVLENARLLSSIQKQHIHLEKLLNEISLAQENERRRVAIEIHDGVAQWMVGATYDINACSTLIAESRFADLELELTKIKKTLQKSVKELRRAIANLRPLPLEEMGLTGALRQATAILDDEGIRCYTRVDGNLPKLTLAEETTTYWIIQEILTNIRNHSGATDVNINIRYQSRSVSVEVSDNGQGFNINEIMNDGIRLGHMGLLGMKERAELLGGYLSINSNLGEGTSIGFTFPASSRTHIKTQ
jgi:signal transduction histidine kinase